MADVADQAQRYEQDHLRRALDRRRVTSARICTVCGEPIPTDELPADPDVVACGRHSWSR
ncbi:MAG: hypothetical protein RIB45_17800 [Marivibrio sp.]|uniref:hypothetical protein n=1 Tax=Marivibrio sp. TaxID=2039719 RepID=UPI0032EBA758